MPTNDDRLEAVMRDLARQNEAWERAKQALSRFADAPLCVPRDVLDDIDQLGRVALPPTPGIRA